MFRKLTAAALAAILLSVSVAQATPSTGPSTQPTRGPIAGDTASPGDAFRPLIVAEQGKPAPKGQDTPYAVSCRGIVNADGTFTIFLENESGKPIPKNSTVLIDYPGGQLGLRVDPRWPDDTKRKGTLPAGTFLPAGSTFECTATVNVWKAPDLGN